MGDDCAAILRANSQSDKSLQIVDHSHSLDHTLSLRLIKRRLQAAAHHPPQVSMTTAELVRVAQIHNESSNIRLPIRRHHSWQGGEGSNVAPPSHYLKDLVGGSPVQLHIAIIKTGYYHRGVRVDILIYTLIEVMPT